MIYIIILYIHIHFQLPPRFDRLLTTLSKFQFSNTCLDVFSTNYLCPLCRNQPLMCPGRCAEVVAGCVSPLNQAVVQLDASLKMILCKKFIVSLCRLCAITT